MTDVKFVVDYRGQYTGEVFYPAGTVATFTDGVAAGLIADGRAVDAVAAQEAQGVYFTPPHVLGAIDPAVGNPPFLAAAIDELTDMPTDWTRIKGVDEVVAVEMLRLGLNTPADVLNFVTMGGDLTTIHNVGPRRAAQIVEWAEDRL